MFNQFHLLISTLLLSSCYALEYRDCGNGQVKGIKVDVCDPEQETCVLTKGKPFTVELDLIPEHDADAVTFHLSSLVFGFPVELPVDDNDACGQKLIECPVKAGVPTKFTYIGKVDASIPMSSVTVVFNLKNGDTEIACVESDLELQDPLPVDENETESQSHQEL
ncbi:mite group 2 allergen Gly d 2.02-like [Panonychus citri]|uniref:mite group 2 allergen Gly d 2.02-like n=1 Tax=Panonychus citri TaxID=50023 RepID=UPI0023077D32|nr:mite group 2 allergen Gly d 2.02-like [Panonychus citri]XP_053201297.1 mite group 2 allergen Gly d 2.02-like [Panonychus citri]